MHVHTQCEVLSAQNRSTFILPSDSKTDFGISSQELKVWHICFCSIALVRCISICEEALGHSEGAQPSVISMYPFHEKLEYACVEWSTCNCSSIGYICVCVCMCVFVCIFIVSGSMCASQTKHTQAEVLVHRYSCLFPPLCSRLVAPFPGSSHLPTLLLFVAFQSWEKQRQLVGSTANPQGQAVFLQKKVEQKYSTGKQTRESSSLGYLTRSPGGGAGTNAKLTRPIQTLAWAIPWLKGLHSFPLCNPVYTHTHTCTHTQTHM